MSIARALRIPCVFVLCVSSWTIGCDEALPTGPTVPLGRDFVLAPGGAAVIEGSTARLTFDRVIGDSRCPADALCILGGDAIVRITVFDNSAVREYDLHTGSMEPVRHDRWTISLTDLSPYQFSAQTFEPSAYRATLRVTR